MPTRPVESTHDEVRHSSPERATAEAEPNHPVAEREAAGAESPSADQVQGAKSLPRDTNADDLDVGDQDIDTAGTAADDQSPTKSL